MGAQLDTPGDTDIPDATQQQVGKEGGVDVDLQVVGGERGQGKLP